MLADADEMVIQKHWDSYKFSYYSSNGTIS